MSQLRSLAAVFLIAALSIADTRAAQALTLAESVAGKILLQVEQQGEAWYVHPTTLLRWFLGRPDAAFAVMRGQGVGITNANLVRIPIGISAQLTGPDGDGDGLSDAFEDAVGTPKGDSDGDDDGFSDGVEVRNGYSPFGAGMMPRDTAFAAAQKGRIFLQVEAHGEAWWVNPEDGKRYFLGRPADAFAIMRSFALGITDANLALIARGDGTEAMTIPPAQIAEGAISCGTVVNTVNAAAGFACMDRRLAACLPGTLMLETRSSGQLLNRLGYEIVGPDGGACMVRLTMIDGGFDTSITGKSMDCRFSTSGTFIEGADALGDTDYADCNGSLKDALLSVSSPPAAASEVPFISVAQGVYVGPKRPLRTLIYSQELLDSLWMALYPNADGRPASPIVNFSEEHLLAVFGDRETYDLNVAGLSADTVQAQTLAQSAQCPVSRSQPFEVVRFVAGSVTTGPIAQVATFQPTSLCREATPSTEGLTYTDPQFGFTILLPDPVDSFVVRPVAATSDLPYQSVEFMSRSVREDLDFSMFTIYAIPHDKWPDIEEAGGISVVTASSYSFFSVARLGADTIYVYAARGSDAFAPDDVPEYSVDELAFVE